MFYNNNKLFIFDKVFFLRTVIKVSSREVLCSFQGSFINDVSALGGQWFCDDSTPTVVLKACLGGGGFKINQNWKQKCDYLNMETFEELTRS